MIKCQKTPVLWLVNQSAFSNLIPVIFLAHFSNCTLNGMKQLKEKAEVIVKSSWCFIVTNSLRFYTEKQDNRLHKYYADFAVGATWSNHVSVSYQLTIQANKQLISEL